MKLGLINSAWVQANQPTVFGLHPENCHRHSMPVVDLSLCSRAGRIRAVCELMSSRSHALPSPL